MFKRNRNTREHFWEQVNKTDTCWIWDGKKNHLGYGYYSFGNKLHKAHRFSYEELVGQIPEGYEIDHLCRVRDCVNPSHLEPVTGKENTRRGESPSAKFGRRTHCGKGHPLSGDNLAIRKSRARGGTHRACLICERVKSKAGRERRLHRIQELKDYE